jgi:uncharacterized protein
VIVLKKITIFYYLLFAVSIFVILAPSVHAQNIVLSDDKPTLSVIGEAEKQITPDQSKISLAVENTATDSNIARKDNAEKMGKIITTLNIKGLTNKNISTSNFEIRPNYDNQNNNYEKIISYTALNKITLTTSANVNISSYIDLAVNNGVNRVESIEFTTSKKVIGENYNELLKEAFINAKQKAEILSAEGGFLINGVKKIDISQDNGNQPTSPLPSPYTFKSNTLSSPSQKTLSTPTQILPQENNLIVDLPVTFFITNKIQ